MSVHTHKLAERGCRWSQLARTTLLGLSLGAGGLGGYAGLYAQSPDSSQANVAYLPYAQFKIPFSVQAAGVDPVKVQLWVSTDEGDSWQIHGSVPADARNFDFRAAAEGLYYFNVYTVDASGETYPSPSPPLKVLVDTTKPQAAVQADVNSQGQLVVDIRVIDDYLTPESAILRLRTDQSADWQELPVESLNYNGTLYEGQAVIDLAPCRELAIVFSIRDQANNEGEATFQYRMPRTAAGDKEMTLASTQAGEKTTANGNTLPRLTSLPGATRWRPSNAPASMPAAGTPAVAGSAAKTTPADQLSSRRLAQGPGSLVSNDSLSLEPPAEAIAAEELPAPAAIERPNYVSTDTPPEADSLAPQATSPAAVLAPSPTPSNNLLDAVGTSTVNQAFHCKSRAFSLDYSVEALGGSGLADVELWGTEDSGRNWQKWGSDPDRQSPFDVRVGNDGLFGFRMVIVGANGIVSHRPHAGDEADVWINIDTSTPTVRITRAVFGQGQEDGMLVIDYQCDDPHLVERPLVLSYSERPDGPWTLIASGLANTGSYLWKADPSLPAKVYLKLECVDKAGNVAAHRLDLPIDIARLAPRGFIQGFRPIESPTP